jgi:peptide/nickel transport system substrate-binding protein
MRNTNVGFAGSSEGESDVMAAADSHTVRRRLGATIAVAALVAISATTGASAQSDEDITFTVGVSQEIDSLNVTVGALVVDYEVWNLQFATLTDKADADFAVQPGLAESWESSDDKLTWTYTLREGLQWSDGEPLTADDIAYTVNRSRDEAWYNHESTVVNLTATAIDDRTLEIVSAVPDPKLPVLDVYIVPPHVYEELDVDQLAEYDGEDGVGSGPFVLTEHEPGEFWRLERNPNWYGPEPYVNEVIFRYFADSSQMITALENGEVDAVDTVPADLLESVENNDALVVASGNQGSFSEMAINPGHGLGDGHPALGDVAVRRAISHAIDREVLFEEIAAGRGEVGSTLPVSALPDWEPDIPEDEQFTYDPERANQLLDDAGYLDTDGDGIREMPDGSNPLELRLYLKADSDEDVTKAEFIGPWLNEIGIGIEELVATETELTSIIARGEYDMFFWGWTPFVDPDPMLSYFTCNEISQDPESPGYNDANWCNEQYDEWYTEQNSETDPDRRREIVHDMLRLFHDEAPYVVLYKYDDISAYSNEWTGFVRQPAETGPVLFTNSSHTYREVRPVDVPERGTDTTGGTDTSTTTDRGIDVEADDSDDGLSIGVIVGGIVGVGAIGAIIAASVLAGRRRRQEDRE